MKRDRFSCRFYQWLPGIVFCLFLAGGGTALAADTGDAGSWRPIYDEVMRWLNFAIFVFFIVKFGRAPLSDFLKGKKKEVADEIQQVELQKQRAEEDVRKITRRLEERNRRLEEIRARIVSQGEKRKEEIIAAARAESELMLKAARTKIAGQIASAKNRLKAELVDEAIAMAMQRLPDEITAQDNTKIVNEYIQAMTD